MREITDHDTKITIPAYDEAEDRKKRYIATVEEDYARDTQIYIGTSPENAFESDEWVDVKHPSLYLGVMAGPDEETVRKELAAQVGCFPGVITLQEIEQEPQVICLKQNKSNMIDVVADMINHADDLELDVWMDGSMILTDSKEAFEKMDAFFHLFGLDYTTGEIDQVGDHYYLDFEFSGSQLSC